MKNQRVEWSKCSGGTKGGIRGHFLHVGGSAPTCPPGKKCKNEPFLAIFWIFTPSDTHFSPLMPPTKKKKKKKKKSGAATE